jgi:hypothetical protein
MSENQPERQGQRVPVRNMWQLKELCEREFGDYTGLFLTSLKKISGYEAPRGMMARPDPEEEHKKILAAMEWTEITPEIVESINKSIAGVVRINQNEIDFFKTRAGKENYVADCQKVVDALKGKRVVLDEMGVTIIKEEN